MEFQRTVTVVSCSEHHNPATRGRPEPAMLSRVEVSYLPHPDSSSSHTDTAVIETDAERTTLYSPGQELLVSTSDQMEQRHVARMVVLTRGQNANGREVLISSNPERRGLRFRVTEEELDALPTGTAIFVSAPVATKVVVERRRPDDRVVAPVGRGKRIAWLASDGHFEQTRLLVDGVELQRCPRTVFTNLGFGDTLAVAGPAIAESLAMELVRAVEWPEMPPINGVGFPEAVGLLFVEAP